jgi:2-dehydro-3-deoxy-D-arabinonate dehydratase
MKLARVALGNKIGVAIVDDAVLRIVDLASHGMQTLGELLSNPDLEKIANNLKLTGETIPAAQVNLLPPIDHQEVWAAGVTYKRSQKARMEESEAAADCYDRVYAAPRPEIFFKATPNRCVGDGGALRIRVDATWNVPEPELALVVSRDKRIVGYTIGNDMSSRDIEGENPLYLPQAKVYNQCCGLGPWITLAGAMPPRDEIGIALSIERSGQIVFQGETSVKQLNRKLEDLVDWLGKDNDFPNGVFLLTGTGVVPANDFTLKPADKVVIEISGIGRLTNTIVQGR